MKTYNLKFPQSSTCGNYFILITYQIFLLQRNTLFSSEWAASEFFKSQKKE